MKSSPRALYPALQRHPSVVDTPSAAPGVRLRSVPRGLRGHGLVVARCVGFLPLRGRFQARHYPLNLRPGERPGPISSRHSSGGRNDVETTSNQRTFRHRSNFLIVLSSPESGMVEGVNPWVDARDDLRRYGRYHSGLGVEQGPENRAKSCPLKKLLDIESTSNFENSSISVGQSPGTFDISCTHRRKLEVSFLTGVDPVRMG